MKFHTLFFLLFVTVSVFGQVKKIQYSGTEVKIIVTGSIRGVGGGDPTAEDPIPLVVWYVSNKQDGSSAEAVVVNGTHYYDDKPDTITFTSNSNQDYLLAFALIDGPIISTNFVEGSAFFLDINGIKDTITLKHTLNIADLITTLSLSKEKSQPENFSIKQNYPNPFNPSTTIEYTVSGVSNVQIKIFNLNGQLVKTLVDENKVVGNYSIEWNGRDGKGNLVASGTYLYQIQTGDLVQEKKMILLK